MAIASRVSKRALSTFAAAKLPEAVAAAGEAVATAEPPSVTPLSSSSERIAAGGSVLQFEDTRRLFAGEPTSALVRTLAALQAMSVGPLVDVATAALRSPAVAGSALGRAAARATAYKHFCAGEAADEAAAVVRRLWRGGMGGILDYGIEDAEDGEACDRNAAGFIAAVDVAASLPPGSVSRRRPSFPSFFSAGWACVAVGREDATSDGIFGAACPARARGPPDSVGIFSE
jgi:proline dehydrogenase